MWRPVLEGSASVVGVGPIGYDDVETPFGSYRHLLGGSAVFFGLAAAVFAPTRIVAAVGDDLRASDLELLASHGVDVSRVTRLKGRSHHWSARYAADLSAAETLENDLGVMAGWLPTLPEQRAGDLLFLGSLEPTVQVTLVRGVHPGVFTVLDTQSHWIELDRRGVLEATRGSTMICVNEVEAMQLTGAGTIDDAATALLDNGSEVVVIKSGMQGATLHHAEGRYKCPSIRAKRIEDPTGAGDSFAGGMLGHLATLATRDLPALAEALCYGVACSSLTVERPAAQRVRSWSLEEIRERRGSLPRLVRA